MTDDSAVKRTERMRKKESLVGRVHTLLTECRSFGAEQDPPRQPKEFLSLGKDRRPLEYAIYPPDVPSEVRSVIEYASDGGWEQTVDYGTDGSIVGRTVRTGSTSSRLSEDIEYDASGAVRCITRHRRRPDGSRSETTFVRPGAIMLNRVTGECADHQWRWEFDERERPIRAWQYLGPRHAEEFTFAYEGDVQTETKRVVSGAEEWTEVTRREQDEDGTLLRESTLNEDTCVRTEHRLRYNEHGDLIEDEFYSSDTESSTCAHFEYEYDISGNWTECAKYMQYSDSSDRDLVEVQYRTITYYDEE